MNLKTFLGGIEMIKDQVVTAPCAVCEKSVVATSRRVPSLRAIEDHLGREAEVVDVESLGLCSECAEMAEDRGVRLHNVEAAKGHLATIKRERALERAAEDAARRARAEKMNVFLAPFLPTSHSREALPSAKVIGRIGEPVAAVDPKFTPTTKRGRRRKDDAA